MKKTLKAMAMLGFAMLSFTACKEKTETAKAKDENKPLVLSTAALSEKFSPFFEESAYDQYIVASFAESIISNDRSGEFIMNGIEGETKKFNSSEYTYTGISDVKITENKDGTVFYDFTLRDDVKFSDGKEMTIDDFIFSCYVNSDPTYDGPNTFYSLPIKGMNEYREGMSTLSKLLGDAGESNADFSLWTKDDQDKFWNAVNDGGVKFAKGIVDYCVKNNYCKEGEVAKAAANWSFAGLKADATEKDFFLMIAQTYNWNFSAMEKEKGDSDSLSNLIPKEVYDFSSTGVTTGSSKDYIEGIVKTGKYSARIILTEASAPAIEKLGVHVSPLHWYGDESLYDYENHKFGFVKGNLSKVRSRTTTPLGAGPYVFKEYTNKTVYMEANPYYYKGVPKTKYIQWKETLDSDMITGIVQGSIDASNPSVSKEKLLQIKEANSNGELTGDTITSCFVEANGYGYIGMSAKNVKVGNNPGSYESKCLRKAIATVICSYRDVVIDSYYGDSASVINYPITNASWAAPKKSDADYEIAFSKDSDGNPIYDSSMSESEKQEAALKAALGFFEKAGYTVENGKLVKAPEGAKLEYEALIAGDGKGDHPSFGILTSASEAFAKIGFKFVVTDLSDSSILWTSMQGGVLEIWCAAWGATLDPDMYQVYHSKGGSNYTYSIQEDELDRLIIEGRTNTNQAFRKAIYKEALDFIMDYAVEVPIYQRKDVFLYSTKRLDTNTIIQDHSSYYKFIDEMYKFEIR